MINQNAFPGRALPEKAWELADALMCRKCPNIPYEVEGCQETVPDGNGKNEGRRGCPPPPLRYLRVMRLLARAHRNVKIQDLTPQARHSLSRDELLRDEGKRANG